MTALVCWQPVLTDHQRHTLDALGHELGTTPDYIVASRALAERQGQGWTTPDVPVTMLPAAGLRTWVAARIAADPEAVHIFGSPFGDRRLIGVLRQVLASGACVWLVSEPWPDIVEGYFGGTARWLDRLKATLRPWLYRVYGAIIRRRVAGVFAISPLAVRQYAAIGVPQKRIVPFGYFVPASPAITSGATPPKRGLRVAFVGALMPRKGIGDLAAAAALLSADTRIAIDVYGPGTPPPGLTYRGRIAFGSAVATLADYDVLVVPSRHDGWGVVVNEGIMAGAAVVASDRTGAGAMIDRWGCGARFPAGDAAALARVLEAIAADPARLATMRAAARALAPQLTPTRAAAYVTAAIRGQPEANPWY